MMMRVTVVCLFVASGVSAQGTKAPQEAQASLAAAAFQAPGLDVMRLNHFFDAARVGLKTLILPPQAPAQPSKPNPDAFIAPAARAIEPTRPLVVDVPAASPAYRRAFSQLLAVPTQTDRYDDIILRAAYKHHLDARLLKAIIAAESSFSIAALSPKGAHGLMQLMPATARYMGFDPKNLRDPEQNIAAGAAYMAELFSIAWRKYKLKGVRFHDVPQWLLQRVIAAYNAGPRFLFHDRFYPESRAYVRKVLLFYRSAVTDLRRNKRPVAQQPTLSLPAAALN